MNDIAKENRLYAFQTDTIEGWMYQQNNHSWNVTVTSTHSVILERHVPVFMSVTKNRAANDYKHCSHCTNIFQCSLRCLHYVTKVHFARMVLRIKNNHKYVPIDDQERF